MKKNTVFLWGLLFLVLLGVSYACIPNWHQNTLSCRTNNTYIISYTDANNCNSTNYPYDYGWEDYCNYCSEDLQETRANCIGNTQAVSWTDLNFYSCCDVTGLSSDCDILSYPYNAIENQSCYWENLSSDMGNLSCQTHPNVGIKDKEYCIAHIPLQYSNETFKCIAIITNGYTDEIIQTTPEYKETSQTFINLNPEADTRQFFSPANSIVNFYYTGKNLHPDNEYILTIECSSAERTLRSQMNFQITYEDVSFVFFRTKWLMDNAPYIIGGVILLIILLLIGWALYHGVLR